MYRSTWEGCTVPKDDESKLIVSECPKGHSKTTDEAPLVIPDEAKAMASQIINEAIKLIPAAPPTTNVAVNADYSAILRKLDTLEKNLYVVFCICEKILGELAPTPDELKTMARAVDKKVIKERMKGERHA